MTLQRALRPDGRRLRRADRRSRCCWRRWSGPTSISLRRVFDFSIPFADNVDAQIFFVARLPRTLAGALRRRAVRRRPASSSRGCCATRWRRRSRSASRPARRSAPCSRSPSTGRSRSLGISAVPVAAFAGSLIAVGIVYALAQARHRGLSTTVLLLAGVTMNAFFSAMILFVQYFAELRRHLPHAALADGRPRHQRATSRSSRRCRRWSWRSRVFAWLARPLNLLSLGADSAESRGLDVARAQRAAFFSASLATGAAVSIGGPIGFVGIIIPHLVRLLVGPGSPPRAAGVGALRRRVPRRLRPRRAHHPRAGRTAGRHHHRAHRRTVLPMAADQKTLTRRTGVLELLISLSPVCVVLLSWCSVCLHRRVSADFQISKSPNSQIQRSSRSCPRPPRCSTRSAPGRAWSASAATTPFRRR